MKTFDLSINELRHRTLAAFAAVRPDHCRRARFRRARSCRRGKSRLRGSARHDVDICRSALRDNTHRLSARWRRATRPASPASQSASDTDGCALRRCIPTTRRTRIPATPTNSRRRTRRLETRPQLLRLNARQALFPACLRGAVAHLPLGTMQPPSRAALFSLVMLLPIETDRFMAATLRLRRRHQSQEDAIFAANELLALGKRVILAPLRVVLETRPISLVIGKARDVVNAVSRGGRALMRREISDEVSPAARDRLPPCARIGLEGVDLEGIDVVTDEAGDHGHLRTFQDPMTIFLRSGSMLRSKPNYDGSAPKLSRPWRRWE